MASGTGQHAAHFAAALPGLTFQPTERPDADMGRCGGREGVCAACCVPVRCNAGRQALREGKAPRWPNPCRPCSCAAPRSIRAWGEGLPNMRPPLPLNAAQPDGWPVEAGGAAAVFAANLTHISPWAATQGLLRGAGRALRPDGLLFVYGPFRCGRGVAALFGGGGKPAPAATARKKHSAPVPAPPAPLALQRRRQAHHGEQRGV